MASCVINDKFDSWQLKELNFPCPKNSENYVKFIVNCTRNYAINSTNFQMIGLCHIEFYLVVLYQNKNLSRGKIEKALGKVISISQSVAFQFLKVVETQSEN